MNVSEITMPREAAQAKLEAFRTRSHAESCTLAIRAGATRTGRSSP